MISTIGTTTIQTTAPNSLVMNPTSMLVEMKSFIPSSYTFETEIQKIKQELLTSNLDCSAKDETNEQYLYEMQDIIDHLPKLPEIQQQKLTIPEFDEIEVKATDSVEIKKFIRKVNYEFLGFHCNHKVMDKDCDMVYKNISDIYKSEEFKTYDNFVSLVAECVWQIRDKDRRGKVWNKQIRPAMFEMKRAIDALVVLAGFISMYNAKMNPQCSKCKAAMRRYNYSVKEIERMRNDYADLKKEAEKPAEDKMDMLAFLNKNYPTADDFLLSDVKKKYKETFGIVKTFDVLKEEIEATKLFKVSRIHNVYHVKRL
ncbi:organellar and viral DNA polymerase type B [Trichomonas vaginalis G3]|uniref:organellar and viral DNA polymerase type B n=1 Tax=Trichomonas vaginalis (strain ATCC PRA-98 / G3) TaxID=412133 RepID=UPI0021E5F4C1|nr:organellar and viral DNA polymerase type B [Trichomonas vaginalis G3]KAI5509522.1 organellar and viral DNA polymerase type B [Trichomonas vaginalis G3]